MEDEETRAAAKLTGDFKDMFAMKMKARHDPLCDQYSRIFMVKMLLVCTTIIGVNQYKDEISCIVPESLGICTDDDDPDFIHAACWIQGLYVYKQLLDHATNMAYFGMPLNIDHDGMMNGTSDLCVVKRKFGAQTNPNCVPMEKTFYLQYQWFAFFIASLAIPYYLPYIMFCKVNRDFISFKENVKDDEVTSEQIIESYFQTDSTSRIARTDACLRPILNVVVKMLYACANLICFAALDNVLNGGFLRYGKKWIEWSRLDNSIRYDYMGMRDIPKPGNSLLPPFGYCEFYESARDIKATRSNKFKIMCELSQHILYQYCLLMLWFCIAFGIVISIFGLFHLVWTYMKNMQSVGVKRDGMTAMSLRELEYISYIKQRDEEMYHDIIQKLAHIKSV